MNRPAAVEWLKKNYHDLRSAEILYAANHYTDSIGVDLHYAIEKSFKTFLAYKNKKIPRTHDLPELVIGDIKVENEDILYIANKYHIESTYPQYDRALPSSKEIQKVLEFTQILFVQVYKTLDINIDELKS